MAVQRRYIKIGIPMDDVSVLRWLDKQHNMSDSLRQLIKEDVERGGYSDVFCREVIPKSKVGRKSNAELLMEKEALEQEMEPEMVQVRPVVPTVKKPITKPVQQKVQTSNPVQKVRQPLPVKMDDNEFIDPEDLLGF